MTGSRTTTAQPLIFETREDGTRQPHTAIAADPPAAVSIAPSSSASRPCALAALRALRLAPGCGAARPPLPGRAEKTDTTTHDGLDRSRPFRDDSYDPWDV